MRSLGFHSEARAELLEAARHYRAENPSAAHNFRTRVAQAIRFILTYPKASPIIHPVGIRRRVIRKFSYSLLYAIEPDRIRIMAVAHQSRLPEYWMDRL